MVKREHLWLRRELLGIASSGVPGLSQRAKRTGNRHTADAILACMRAKIEGDAVPELDVERFLHDCEALS